MSVVKRQDLLLKSLLTFYKDPKHLKVIYEAINNKGCVSLRIIDFLCTNYSKTQNVVYYNNKSPFNLHLMYRSQLKAYSKVQFDPFRRHSRLTIPCNLSDTKKLETTVAQLNFFKWAIDNKVIDYAHTNVKFIENEMTRLTKKKKTTEHLIVHRHDVHLFVSFK